jgi:S-adenosylhomocysteine hydrolase
MFNRLPVLEGLGSHTVGLNQDLKLIGVQHLMAPCGSMLESIRALGLSPKDMYLCGKAYSTHQATLVELQQLGYAATNAAGELELGSYGSHLLSQVQQMWARFRDVLEPGDKVIILDDGGYALKSCPPDILKNHKVFGIEQTSSGIWDQPALGRMPVINVAASAAKILIEPRIVAESVKLRMGKLIADLEPKTVGVLGYGNVGKAIYEHMRSRYDTIVYDHTPTMEERAKLQGNAVDSSEHLYERSDVILSSTGRDVSRKEWLFNSTGDKTLVSLSSGDVEFNWLIRSCSPYLEEPLTDPLQSLRIRTPNGHLLQVLRGGMVANFTGESESGPGELIQMTRGLLLAAVIQIARDHVKLNGKVGSIMLDPNMQKEVMDLWLADQPSQRDNYLPGIIEGFGDVEWIKANSEGTLVV